MKKIIYCIAAVFICFVGFKSECNAQRHIPGQHVISVDAYAWKQFGASVSWGKCDFLGRSVFSVSFFTGEGEQYKVPATKKTSAITYHGVHAYDWLISGGYLFRAVSNRSRSVNLLLGGTVDLGIRDHVIPSGSTGITDVKFLYCFSPAALFEYFPNKNFALNVQLKPRFQLYGHKVFENVFYPEISVGCSFYFL